MCDDFTPPGGWEQLHWHLDPKSKRYHDYGRALRSSRWLNQHEGAHDCWEFRPGPVVDGRVLLERRWIGRWSGLIAGLYDPPGG
jgi:hypothetical protein